MTLDRLKSFTAIAREGNLTRAAGRLHLSQSALSNQLKLLEDELGLSLFRRTPRGMELSEAGQQLLPFVEDVLETSDKLSRKALALRSDEGETFNIGLNTDPAFLKVGVINRRMSLLLQNVNVVFHATPSVRTGRKLRQGFLDMAFFYGNIRESGLRHLHLTDVRFCIAIPVGLIRGAKPRDWKDLVAMPWIWVEEDSPPYQAVEKEFDHRRIVPNKAVKTVDEFIVKELVAEGQGLAVMREDEARPLVEAGKVLLWERGWLTIPLSLAWLEKTEERKTTRLVREIIAYVWKTGTLVDGGEGDGNDPRYWY